MPVTSVSKDIGKRALKITASIGDIIKRQDSFGQEVILGEAKSSYFLDLTVESGVLYKYKLETDSTYGYEEYIDFEYSCLMDKDTIFNLILDETIDSRKHVVVESTINTLGSKYPFVRRNAATNYKQFTIKGLISYHADDFFKSDFYGNNGPITQGDSSDDGWDPNEKKDEIILSPQQIPAAFLTKKAKFTNCKSWLESDKDTTLDGIQAHPEKEFLLEKCFRDLTEEFLTNGKPKLYKSAAEGCTLVMLSNISFTPKKELGRMLYSFSATATEIDECTYDNFIKYGILEDPSGGTSGSGEGGNS